MTRNYGVRYLDSRHGIHSDCIKCEQQTRAIPVDISPYISQSPIEDARDCLMPMGLTSEAVAEKYGITRQQQDECVLDYCRSLELLLELKVVNYLKICSQFTSQGVRSSGSGLPGNGNRSYKCQIAR